MSPVLPGFFEHAARAPQAPALTDGERVFPYAEVARGIAKAAARFAGSEAGSYALALDNGPAWAIADLALLHADRVCVPLPPFFSVAQQLHALNDAGVRWLVTDRPAYYEALFRELGVAAVRCEDADLHIQRAARFELPVGQTRRLPCGTLKVTYTSGTTGTPKGVCLGSEAIAAVTASLAKAAGFTAGDRHLALLPLSTLLENIAGVYAPLSAGACVVLPSLHRVGTGRATGLTGEAPAIELAAQRATTAITVPQLLRDLCVAIEQGAPQPALRFLAVGGAPVSIELLTRASRLGIPVYQGYGLSECASVVALNTAAANRPGSVGRVLPHASIETAGDGQIHVRGATFLGYTNDHSEPHGTHATGDVGYVDQDGFLYITGRMKNMFITSHGRNVSPEWVESELTASDAIAQAWVYGESRPYNVAIITPTVGADATLVDAGIEAANSRLPDYARVTRWMRSTEPFSGANAQLTTNGRLRRELLLARYGPLLDQFYQENEIELS